MQQHDISSRPWRRPAIAVAAIALAGGLTTAATAQAAAAASPAATTTITMLSVIKTNTPVPHGSIEVDIVKNPAGKNIGSDSVICHGTGTKPPKCALSISLSGGYLFFSVTGTPTGVAGPLVGGTGKYAHATGKAVGTGISASTVKVVVTLHT